MKTTAKTLATAAILAFATPAIAGGVTVAENGDSKMKIGMKSYINATSSKTTINGVKSAQDTGFAVDRFYLWTSYDIDETWSAKIVLDVNNEQPNNTGLKRNMNVFVKNAFIQGKFAPEATVWLGLGGTPWIPYEESLWGHRFITNTYVDGYAFDDSADFGAGLNGKIADGMLEYNVAAVNGGGYSKPNKSQAIDVNGRLTVHPVEGMDISGGYRQGDRGTNTFGPAGNKSKLAQGLISYGIDQGRLTAGYIKNSVKTGANETVNKGFDVYGWAKMTNAMGLFARYDSAKQTVTGNAVQQKMTRYIGGVDYIYNKNLRFSLAYDQKKTKNNTYTSCMLSSLNFNKNIH